MMNLCRFQFKFLRVFVAYIFVHFISLVSAAPVNSSEIQTTMYLQKYGYVNESSSDSRISQAEFETAIIEFQSFSGLPETGELDNTTLTMMNMPRCGVKDKGRPRGSARRKRYALQGSKWFVTLTYRIRKYPRQLPDKQKVDEEIAKAFKVWSDVTNINFMNSIEDNVDIDIRFEAGDHGDDLHFDGIDGELAHAFYPEFGGDVHFDDEEDWTISQHNGTNLFQVAAHEIGHSLGLSHSDVNTSVMTPLYVKYQPTFSLDEDDILAIQKLYGRLRRKVEYEIPNLCKDANIDAATTTEDGVTYIFKGDYYWELFGVDETYIHNGFPKEISKDWGGLPGDLDAAFTWENGKTFFFKEDKYWSFINKEMDFGCPKTISDEFAGVPNSIDAAFVWGEDGETYFFKGSNYWRYIDIDELPTNISYPQPISVWEGLPHNIDAALQWINKQTYFFKGKSYYRFDDNLFSIPKDDPLPYPRSTSAWWFGCQEKSTNNDDLKKASLIRDDRHPFYIGGDDKITSSNQVFLKDDYMEGEVVDGSEKLDAYLQQGGGNNLATPTPRKGVHDANSGAFSCSSLFLTLLFVALLQAWIR